MPEEKPKRYVVMRTYVPEYTRELEHHARASGKMLPLDPPQFNKQGGGVHGEPSRGTAVWLRLPPHHPSRGGAPRPRRDSPKGGR